MKVIKLLLILVYAGLLLSGCDTTTGNDEIISQAKKLSDPVAAYKLLMSEKDKVDSNSYVDSDKYYQTLNQYMLLAADRMDLDAISHLFHRNDSEAAESKRKQLAPKILELSVTSNDPKILILSAEINDEGKYVIRDTNAAISLYARAWALGEVKAANSASHLYLSINDTINAYLWSLRCINECQRSYGTGSDSTDLSTLESKLAPETIIDLQKQAADKTVFAVDSKV